MKSVAERSKAAVFHKILQKPGGVHCKMSAIPISFSRKCKRRAADFACTTIFKEGETRECELFGSSSLYRSSSEKRCLTMRRSQTGLVNLFWKIRQSHSKKSRPVKRWMMDDVGQ